MREPHSSSPGPSVIDDRITGRAFAGGLIYPIFVGILAFGSDYLDRQPLWLLRAGGLTLILALLRYPCVRLARRPSAGPWPMLALKALIACSGALWGGFLTLTLVEFDYASSACLLTLVCTAGTAGGSVTTHASDRLFSRVFLSFILGPPLVVLALSGSREGWALAALFGMYLAYLLVQAGLEYEVFRRLVDDRHLLIARAHDLEIASRAAEDASRAKSAFLANMSHELRTPLTAIIGYAELLKEEGRDQSNSGRADDINRIVVAGRHLLAVVSDLLDLSKIEAGRMPVELTAFDAAGLMHDVAEIARPLAAAKGNKVEVIVAPDLGLIRSDRTKLRQILINLVGNACKFTENGRVSIRAERDRRPDGVWIVCRVADNGIGIAPDQLPKLFKEFVQGDDSTTRRYGGTGLGLAISQRLSDLLGGRIAVASEIGRGSVFTVELPAGA